MTDTATVSGGSNPTGTVTFRLFSNNTCATQVFASTNRPLTAGSATSAPFTPTAVGTYYWTARYNGDANNNVAVSACNALNESVTITQASPTISTQASAGGPVGTSVTDTATVSGVLSGPAPIGHHHHDVSRPTCDGLAVTIVGTSGNDNIFGTDGPDVIMGRGGNDDIQGLGGDDVICGGDGDDTVSGGGGNDRLFAASGDDTVYGNHGDDVVRGGTGDDALSGGNGRDQIFGEAGNDHLAGEDEDDELYGARDDDFVNGGKGNDVCGGGSGSNQLINCEVFVQDPP